jgi:hypothetical protein
MRGSGLQGSARLNGAAPERRGGTAMGVNVGGIASSVDQELRSALRGRVICPDDLGYDAARAVFNGIIDRRPLAVIRPVDASDVVRCIEFVRRHDLPISVRGGGHSVAGTLSVTGRSCLTCPE